MTGLADVDEFKLFFEVCVLLRFSPLKQDIKQVVTYLYLFLMMIY